MKNIWSKEVQRYLFYGVLTTIVNYTVFAVGLDLMGEDMVLGVNMIAFVYYNIGKSFSECFAHCKSGLM